MSERVLPTFFLCGAPKAGTTSLYEYCAEHPEVCMSRPKETGFFFEDYEKGIDWFSNACFPHYDGQPAVGEASAGNMMHREVAPRISTHCPDARLVFVLRDPVERIWSHYRFDINVGALPPTADFSALIRDESSEWRSVMMELGMYHDQLVNYADHFSRDQMRVFLFETFADKTEHVVSQLFEFINVAPTLGIDTTERHNESAHLTNASLYQALYRMWTPVKTVLPDTAVESLFGVRSAVRGVFFRTEDEEEKPTMEAADRQYLSEIYERPNARLGEWLGRDLSHWT